MDYDAAGHVRPGEIKHKKILKTSSFDVLPLLNVFKENGDPFGGTVSDGDMFAKERLAKPNFHSDNDEPKRSILRGTGKLIRKKAKHCMCKNCGTKEEEKKDPKQLSSVSFKDQNPNPISIRHGHPFVKDLKMPEPKDPMRKIIKFGKPLNLNARPNGLKTKDRNLQRFDDKIPTFKKTDIKGLKTDGSKPGIDKRVMLPKVAFKQPSKPSNPNKYPLLTQSHVKYSKKEEPKQPSPTDKQPLSKVEDEKQPKDEALSSKIGQPMLQYNLNLGALMKNFENKPLAGSGLSNLGKAAEAREQSRLDGLKLQLKQNSKMQPSSQPKEEIVPTMSKVIGSGDEKKENHPTARFGSKMPKQGETFKPSSSSSDSDESETPKEMPKGSKVYTNDTPGDVRKSGLKKTYKEDEGNETPSNSQSGSKFNLLKSPKNKNAAPNASGAKPKLTKLPSSQNESQQIGFKTIEGPKESSKEETPKSEAKDKKSDENASSDEEKQLKHSESHSSHRGETPKSDKDGASDDDKKSFSSKRLSKKSVTSMPNGDTPKEETPKSEDKKQSDSEASKKSDEENKSDNGQSSDEDRQSLHSKHSSKKSVKASSHNNYSEKHAFDSEGLKSGERSDKEDKSSKHNDSSDAEDGHSEEENEGSKEE